MEHAEVVRRRRMVRAFLAEPLPEGVADRLLAAAIRAPSAGFSQGWAFLVLEDDADRNRFWALFDGGEWPAPPELRRAPLVIVPLSCKRAYLERYAEPDKGWEDLDEARWPAPYWDIDTGMAALLVLLAAVDEGLGALFFGIPPTEIPPFRQAFGVPDDHLPIGAIAVGRPDPAAAPTGSARTRRRLGVEAVAHRGRW